MNVNVHLALEITLLSRYVRLLVLGLKANFVGLGHGNIQLWSSTYGLGRPGLGINYKAKLMENGDLFMM